MNLTFKSKDDATEFLEYISKSYSWELAEVLAILDLCGEYEITFDLAVFKFLFKKEIPYMSRCVNFRIGLIPICIRDFTKELKSYAYFYRYLGAPL